ncbi:hypothetical protein KP509_20G073300 [Ceratopteris richardii]|uniref:Galactose oxidase n=1 Tax=Ceratopteris richardii TaxID=49495 RepID=A0A8T2SGC3_CERRI|nr:hypothetical protein KP509_20G073300 [Ceratopteris richardii]
MSQPALDNGIRVPPPPRRLLFLLSVLLFRLFTGAAGAVSTGNWHMLVPNAGVSAMHMTLTHMDTVIMYDRTDYGPSQLRLPNGNCRRDPRDLALKVDCYAHAIEYDISSNRVSPLEIQTDSWCSSGATLADGTFVSTGGYNDGSKAVRHFTPCAPGGTCDLNEDYPQMGAARWYASNQILPDNSMIVVGGRASFSYEFVPSKGDPVPFPFLRQTNVPGVENNLYPFLHLSTDGNLFVFANKMSILLDYKSNKVIREFPDLPGGGRNYPSSGSSVMLPLSSANNFERVEVLICGGAPDGSFQQASLQMKALQTCGRMVITDPNPSWAMETMSTPRVMGDMLILPTGEVIIINGGLTGTAGWQNVDNPNFAPVLYKPDAEPGARFQELAATTIPRLYHSSANVLPDGRILVAGSNPNVGYTFIGVKFPTELSMQAYHPYYLDYAYDNVRPVVTYLSKREIGYGAVFTVEFKVGSTPTDVQFRAYYPPLTTHTYSQNQRQLVLSASPLQKLGTHYYSRVLGPPSSIVAPSGYYLLHVLNAGIPSGGLWVRFA